MYDDIPEARRDVTSDQKKLPRSKTLLFLLLVAVGAMACLWLIRAWVGMRSSTLEPVQPPVQVSPTATATPTPVADQLLGHFAYREAPATDLKPVLADGGIKLRTAAARKYLTMEAAAKADGINLVPISGFRSVQDQNHLFFDVKAERGQVATERAQVSAPPGYSEHHTGYAIDLGDGSQPESNLSVSFENTPAFRWLQSNAAHFSYELSFPQSNPQGVTYEPWHWRFVGDSDSLQTFYQARQRK